MKVIHVISVLFLVSCQLPSAPSTTQTTTDTPAVTPHYAIVKDSLWNTTRKIALDTVARSASNPTLDEVKASVEAANALSLTSQEWVYLDNAPDITDAPNGNVFYVEHANGMVRASFLNLTRQYIVDNYQMFLDMAKTQYGGDDVYVDHVPSPPVLAKDTTPYEWYSMYIVEDSPESGTILAEDHCGYNSDETWSGQWITTPEGQFAPDGKPGGGWADVDAYFEQRLQSFQLTVTDYAARGIVAHVVSRQIYPPLPTVITGGS